MPDWLPADLREFFAEHEGVGREASPDHPVRLCCLAEVVPVAVHDLHLFAGFPPAGGWDRFAGIRVGVGCFFDGLVYVTAGPVCPPGSIVAFGVDTDGPAGTGGDADPVGSLVLAHSFGEWIGRLRTDAWDEVGLVPGEVDRLPPPRARQLRSHFARLNPRSGWARG